MSALFPSKKAHITQKTSSRQTTSRPHDKKNPDIAISELFFDKEYGYMIGSPSMKNQGDFKRRPSSSLCQTARDSGATPKWEYFFLKKGTHHAKISRSATWFCLRKHLDDACSYSTRLEGTR